MKKINKTNCTRSLISIILMITALFVIPGCTSPANQETPTGEEAEEETEETEETEEEETQLNDFEQACEDIGIPHELGNKLKDKIGEWARPEDHYNEYNGKVEHKIYEDGEGFVPYGEGSYQGECRIVGVAGVFYCVPKNTETYRTKAYEVLWQNSTL